MTCASKSSPDAMIFFSSFLWLLILSNEVVAAGGMTMLRLYCRPYDPCVIAACIISEVTAPVLVLSLELARTPTTRRLLRCSLLGERDLDLEVSSTRLLSAL